MTVRSNKYRDAHSAEVSDHLLGSRTTASNQETLLQNYRQVGTASAISATLRAETFGRHLPASAAPSEHLPGSVRNGARDRGDHDLRHIPKSPCRLKMTSSCAGCTSPTVLVTMPIMMASCKSRTHSGSAHVRTTRPAMRQHDALPFSGHGAKSGQRPSRYAARRGADGLRIVDLFSQIQPAKSGLDGPRSFRALGRSRFRAALQPVVSNRLRALPR